ncbi:MAG: FAD-binding domain-containing protein [Pseudomonadota bacterium]
MEPTREAASEALAAFLPRAGRAYAKSRNYDFGPDTRGNVSTLSPYTRHRIITEQQIAQAVLQRHALSSAEKFIQEVCWRTYWKGWLEHRPTLWPLYLDAVERDFDALKADDVLAAAYAEAIESRTGIECFDTWSRELQTTGYLHNHARMWFASIWIFTLELPWTLGADFFYTHLFDGDPASNTLSWRWVAGLQTKGKTYLARSDNIATFTEGRFPDTPQLAGAALPVDDVIPELMKTPLPMRATPPADTNALLLLHEDDLHPESLPLNDIKLTGIAALGADTSRLRLARHLQTFRQAALRTASEHTSKTFNIPAMPFLPVPDAGSEPDMETLAADLKAFAAKHGSGSVVTAEAPVGPARKALDDLEPHLEAAGLKLYRLRRNWDAAFWPHATAGFFKLKNKIPRVLEDLELLR